MGKLTFGMMVSLDGYINDAEGHFDWGQIDAEVHRHANDEERRVGTEIYGRRMYETMAAWETYPTETDYETEFAEIWRGNDKIVVSKSLSDVTTSRTRLVSQLDADEVRRMKAEAKKDISVSGPTLASSYLDAGLVDEVGIYYVPVVVGSGTPMFANVKRTLVFERIEERAFANGLVYIRYRLGNAAV